MGAAPVTEIAQHLLGWMWLSLYITMCCYTVATHAGKCILQHKFLWGHHISSWVLGAPWPVEMFLTSPSVPQQRSGLVPEALTSRQQAAASALRQVCAGKRSVAVATVNHKIMRPDCEPWKPWYIC